MRLRQGRNWNWKCVVPKCIATLKSETKESGVEYTPKYLHNHSPTVINSPKRSIGAAGIDSKGRKNGNSKNLTKTHVEVIKLTPQEKKSDVTKIVECRNRNGNTPVLPFNQSVQSMGRPVTSTPSHSETPLVESVPDFRYQIHCLTQEIINKQIEIENLKATTEIKDSVIDSLKAEIKQIRQMKMQNFPPSPRRTII